VTVVPLSFYALLDRYRGALAIRLQEDGYSAVAPTAGFKEAGCKVDELRAPEVRVCA
jgi:hypothetical protein